MSYLKIGHRGCRGLYPENTIEGFKRSLQYGVDGFELDVVVSKDKKIVVSHEPYMNPIFCLSPDGVIITDKEYNLFHLNYEEIKKFDCGSKKHLNFPQQDNQKEYKPLLEDLFKNFNTLFDIEIKSTKEEYNISQPQPEDFVELVMGVIEKNNVENYIIRSFDINPLIYLKSVYPKVKIALLVENDLGIERNIDMLGFKPDIYSPDYLLIDDRTMSYCYDNNIEVSAWTVNNKDDMNKLVSMGVKYIITDYPNL